MTSLLIVIGLWALIIPKTVSKQKIDKGSFSEEQIVSNFPTNMEMLSSMVSMTTQVESKAQEQISLSQTFNPFQNQPVQIPGLTHKISIPTEGPEDDYILWLQGRYVPILDITEYHPTEASALAAKSSYCATGNYTEWTILKKTLGPLPPQWLLELDGNCDTD